ncbi:OmpH/Skp family outer membrane protein [Rickettsia endosymbiont of Cardiosporidium cionae]|uniref:OmpH family outer membrane protein n=1 Tax=Rickettsia endosymbiont of Cardiosporidium cionae TaxID=2777155 RepID=UPI0018943FD9|nr:OmpH family outer membrane protein [Rickettsia endosymbiont of Cardiosporidium cionae]KAF8818777.1 OmpH family outer membrane protein [Rickettsia endosymbiont of Cardiosporidium cionae]
MVIIRLYFFINIILSCIIVSAVASKFEVHSIAVVDIEAIIENSNIIKLLHKKTAKLHEIIQNDIYQSKARILQIEDKLYKQRDTLSASAFNEKLSEFNKKNHIEQKKIQDRKLSLNEFYNKAFNKIYKIVLDVIYEISNTHRFNIVLPSGNVLFFDKRMDITEEVINIINSQNIELDDPD